MTSEEREAIVNRILNDYRTLVKDGLDELLQEFVKDIEKKGRWMATGGGEWAVIVKMADIYDIAEQYCVGDAEEDEQ